MLKNVSTNKRKDFTLHVCLLILQIMCSASAAIQPRQLPGPALTSQRAKILNAPALLAANLLQW